MKIYLSHNTEMPKRIKRAIFSYHYIQKTPFPEIAAQRFVEPYPDLFLDSGAFTAHGKGTPINLSAYCAYLHQYKKYFSVYANLDVIGNAAGTLANQKRMEKEGLAPLPVFHMGEDWKYLFQYVERYPYIALGGLVPYMRAAKRSALMRWLLRCFQIAKGKSVFHGFGCTAAEVMCAFPWYSVDSSTCLMGFRFAEMRLFDQGKIITVELGKHDSCYQYAKLLRSLGFDPSPFARKDRDVSIRLLAGEASAASFVKAEEWIEQRQGKIDIPERIVA